MLKRYDAFSHFNIEMLEIMWTLYNTIFFKGTLNTLLMENKIKINLEVSERNSHSVAGHYNNGTICILSTIFDNIGSTTKNITQTWRVNGISCFDRLMCVQAVFEHELTHMFQYNFFQEKSEFLKVDKLGMAFAELHSRG
jgi:hypothetical protein